VNVDPLSINEEQVALTDWEEILPTAPEDVSDQSGQSSRENISRSIIEN